MNKTLDAIHFFEERYGKTPEELGFPAVDIYERQNAFLYAVSSRYIQAYKTQQNILYGLMMWFNWPLGIDFFVWLIAFAKHEDYKHPLCIVCYVFYGVWATLLIVLDILIRRVDKKIKLGTNIIYLNY